MRFLNHKKSKSSMHHFGISFVVNLRYLCSQFCWWFSSISWSTRMTFELKSMQGSNALWNLRLGMRTAVRIYDPEGDNKKKKNCMDINSSGGFMFLELMQYWSKTFGCDLAWFDVQFSSFLATHPPMSLPLSPGWLALQLCRVTGKDSCCWWGFAVQHLWLVHGDRP